MKHLSWSIALALALSGCTGLQPTGGAGLAGSITVRGDIRVAKAGYGLQAAAEAARVPYELARLDHVDVFIQDVTAGAPSAPAGTLTYIGAGDADHTFDPIVLANLKPYHQYKVTLEAWQFDPAAGAIVRVDDNTAGASETTFDTHAASQTDAANESVTLAAGFALKLKDQDFNGRASGALGTDLAVQNGTILGPTKAPRTMSPAEIKAIADADAATATAAAAAAKAAAAGQAAADAVALADAKTKALTDAQVEADQFTKAQLTIVSDRQIAYDLANKAAATVQANAEALAKTVADMNTKLDSMIAGGAPAGDIEAMEAEIAKQKAAYDVAVADLADAKTAADVALKALKVAQDEFATGSTARQDAIAVLAKETAAAQIDAKTAQDVAAKAEATAKELADLAAKLAATAASYEPK